MQGSKKILSVLIIIVYLTVLFPYTIVSNAGEAGIIVEDQRVDVNSLPNDVQDILINKKDSYNIILIEDLITNEKYQIAENTYQIAKQRKLVLSGETQEKGSFIKVNNITNDIYIAYDGIQGINQSFDKLVIGDVKKAKFGGIIELIHHKLPAILTLSAIDSLAGGLLLVLVLTVLFHRMVALWNIPAIITLYSFQTLLANLIAGMNKLEIEPLNRLFGFLFIVALPLTFKLKTFEESIGGKQHILDLYQFNIKIVKKVLNKFGF